MRPGPPAGPGDVGIPARVPVPGGRVVPAEELLDRVWDEAADPFTTTVKTTIRRLRGKLGEPPVIETIREAGYRISSQ